MYPGRGQLPVLPPMLSSHAADADQRPSSVVITPMPLSQMRRGRETSFEHCRSRPSIRRWHGLKPPRQWRGQLRLPRRGCREEPSSLRPERTSGAWWRRRDDGVLVWGGV
ncbi:Os02g0734733 [Oryza sativa Japonica Group]|uniref:Os02g0734733 protein n=1 Tax=Oryza sativa subsp. japonica TaxID=39947 RepID=A0A0P0VP89_ORYSJ|nr:Os02g0734733 [Oryza sativa Japonica Group]